MTRVGCRQGAFVLAIMEMVLYACTQGEVTEKLVMMLSAHVRPRGGPAANISLQRTRPVSCIAANKVRIEPMVIASPVNPLKKKA